MKKLKENIIEAMRKIYDPELPVNIYDLGLIYGVEIDDKYHVQIQMTLTSPTCPVAETLPLMVESEVRCVKDVKSVTVEIVWDPPWTQELMSEDARLNMGLIF